MTDRLWTSAEVAAALNVGVSSVKRWTNDGRLASIRTAGGHRRYAIAAVREFAHAYGYESEFFSDSIPPAAELAQVRRMLLDALERGDAPLAATLIRDAAAQRGTALTLDRLVGQTLREIGELWENGSWGVEAEHQASHIVADAIDRLRPAAAPGSSLALLLTPPAEQHDLPLRMLRVVLEQNSWTTRYIGANTPWNAAGAAVAQLAPALVVLSARSNEPFESPRFIELCRTWVADGITVAIGGEWARGGSAHPEGAIRFRTLVRFEKWLRRGGA